MIPILALSGLSTLIPSFQPRMLKGCHSGTQNSTDSFCQKKKGQGVENNLMRLRQRLRVFCILRRLLPPARFSSLRKGISLAGSFGQWRSRYPVKRCRKLCSKLLYEEEAECIHSVQRLQCDNPHAFLCLEQDGSSAAEGKSVRGWSCRFY